MLRLIPHNPEARCQNALSQESKTNVIPFQNSSCEGFLFTFQETSPRLYVFNFQDRAHGLSCALTLERQESFRCFGDETEEGHHFVPLMACDFPYINGQRLKGKVLGDEYLEGIAMLRFQLKILEELLLFCDDKEAAYLILNFNEINLDYLEIYQQFLISEEDVPTARGTQTEIVIATDLETYDEVIDFMDDVDKKFRQALWRDQKTNPAFRQYLKALA